MKRIKKMFEDHPELYFYVAQLVLIGIGSAIEIRTTTRKYGSYLDAKLVLDQRIYNLNSEMVLAEIERIRATTPKRIAKGA